MGAPVDTKSLSENQLAIRYRKAREENERLRNDFAVHVLALRTLVDAAGSEAPCELTAESALRLAEDVLRHHGTVEAGAAQAAMDSQLWRHHMRMLDALKLVWKKHHAGDASIGWNELDDVVSNALMEVMGDRDFQAFCKEGDRNDAGRAPEGRTDA